MFTSSPSISLTVLDGSQTLLVIFFFFLTDLSFLPLFFYLGHQPIRELTAETLKLMFLSIKSDFCFSFPDVSVICQ